ncbi:hypothetical protein BV22DRAFT_1040470, partial [Leucogyrophana mollusca]
GVDLDVICARKQTQTNTPDSNGTHNRDRLGSLVVRGMDTLATTQKSSQGSNRMSATLLTKNDQQKQVGERQ